jgi:hypothetical protein
MSSLNLTPEQVNSVVNKISGYLNEKNNKLFWDLNLEVYRVFYSPFKSEFTDISDVNVCMLFANNPYQTVYMIDTIKAFVGYLKKNKSEDQIDRNTELIYEYLHAIVVLMEEK